MKAALALAAIPALILAMFGMALLSMFLGGVSGWLFESVFTETYAALQAYVGTNVSGFTMGAALGWVGHFFKSVSINSNS